VLFPELIALYDAFTAGRPSPLPEPTVQYADYVLWQRDYLQRDVLDPHLAYWKRKLADLVPLQLPYDCPRPDAPSFASERHRVRISASTVGTLRAMAQSEGVTLFMALLAVYQALLFRNCAQTEIPVMTFAAGMQREEFRRVLGLFVNFLPLSTTLAADLGFRTLLKRVRATVLEAFSHHDLPFRILMQDARPRLFAGEDRAFQAVFVYSSHSPIGHPKWSLSWTEVTNGAGVRDLSLEMQEHPDGLEAYFQYRSELFRPETIVRLAEHFVSMLDAVAADPGRTLSELV
jgi:non-ribosomal peptide synthetase component F